MLFVIDLLVSFCAGAVFGYFLTLMAVRKMSMQEIIRQAEAITRKAIG